MLTLETVADYAEIIGAIAVLFAIVFALVEFRQLGIQRREYASLEMMRSWESAEYIDAIYDGTRTRSRDCARGPVRRMTSSTRISR